MQLIEKTWPAMLSLVNGSSHPLPRICLLTETYYPVTGGGETQARVLAEALSARGFTVFIIARRSSQSFKTIEDVCGVTVYRIPPVGVGRWKRWGMLVWSFFILAKMRDRYDILYVSGFKALGISAVLASRLFRKICILKADSNGEMSGEFFAAGLKKLGLTQSSLMVRMFLRIRNRILRGANAFVAITSGISKELRDQGVNPELIYSITNSVDTKRFRPASQFHKYTLRQQLNFPSKEVIITYSGRLVSYKGLPLLIRIAHKIQTEHKNVGFVLVGAGGLDIHNCEVDLKDYVLNNGLEDSVYFVGEVDNVHQFLQASDIFVSPTEKDAFPVALIEAMACGLPVISTPVGGIREIITDKQDGLLVEPGDFQQLYDAVSVLIVDKALAAFLGKSAAQTVKERYSAMMVAAKYVELFRNIVGQERLVCSR
jgi:glycosyltransferase involved in cell wall biosynthesis